MLSIYIIRKNKWVFIHKISLDKVTEILKICVPLLPHSVGVFILTCADRFILNSILGLAEISTYLIIIQVSSVFNYLFDAFNKSYYPWLFERLNENNEKTKYYIVIFTYFYFILLFVCAFVFFHYGTQIIELIAGDQYQINNTIVGFIFLGQIFGGMYLMVNNYLFYVKKTGLLSNITILSGSIHMLLVVVLTLKYGIIGASISFCVSKGSQFLLTWFFAQKHLKMPWLPNIK